MPVLRTSDLRAVLDVAWSLAEAGDLATFRQVALDMGSGLVEGDVHGYNEVPPSGGAPLVVMSHTPTAPEWLDALGRLRDEHPLVQHFLTTGSTSTTAISDLMNPRDFVGGEFYRDVLSYADGRDQLAVSMIGDDGLVIGFAINRMRPGFSRRDHEVLDALRPHLVQSYRRVIDRERQNAVLAASDRAVLLVGHDGRVEYVTPAARTLLGDDAPAEGTRLTGPDALTLDGYATRVVAGVTPTWDALVLEPLPRDPSSAELESLGLTPREAEVLAEVARGASNEGIARALGISELTVAKHLTHVYEKLGVPNRTAAVQAARARLGLTPL